MISFFRSGSAVRYNVDTKTGVEKSWLPADRDCGTEAGAEVLALHFGRLMRDALKQIRADAYEQGYKDAKAKRKRETRFWGGW